MKKYLVEIKFKNGEVNKFHTITNVKKLKPMFINGANFVYDKEANFGYNLNHVESIKQTELKVLR